MKIKLMPDYNCHPLWHYQSKDIGNIDPESLSISQELINALGQWATRYDSTLDKYDPINSGFESNKEEQKFVDEGFRLSKKLQAELGNDFEVFYHNIILKKVIKTDL